MILQPKIVFLGFPSVNCLLIGPGAVPPSLATTLLLSYFSRERQCLPQHSSSNQKLQCSPCLMLCAAHPEDDQSAVFLNAGFLTSTVLEGMRQIILRWWERGRERLRECVSLCVCVCVCDMGDYNIFVVPSFCFFFSFFFLLTLTLGLQIGQLHYQSAGPQIFKTNWIAHPIPITITAGTITKLAIQHNNWKCGLPGPAGLPGGPADL